MHVKAYSVQLKHDFNDGSKVDNQWRNWTFADARAKAGRATYSCSTHTHVHLHMDISILFKICCTSYSVCKIAILAIAISWWNSSAGIFYLIAAVR